MKTPIQTKSIPKLSAPKITVILICIRFSQIVHALSPPPDGGYPGGNTAEGQNALFSLTSGGYNTAVGFLSLRTNTTNSFNTALGAGALFLNTADQNTGVGAAALLSNTSGNFNTANGAFALVSNTFGTNNTASGASALFTNAIGNYNTAGGFEALKLANADDNTAMGALALHSDSTGGFNTATGVSALFSNTSGYNNVANGVSALYHNIGGHDNTGVGFQTLLQSTGDYNTALGAGAGANNATGNNNIYIGDAGGAAESNVIAIGSFASSGTNYTAAYVGGIYDAFVSDRQVYIQSNGRLGTLASSRRYKEQIKPMDKTSEALFALQPVTFRYKQEIDPSHRLSFGLIAEDVADVSADLVTRDAEGKPRSVRYDAVNAMLLNEFLKEHKKVDEQQAAIKQLNSVVAMQQRIASQQQKEIKGLVATVKEQALKIQRVSAQLELSKPAPKAALNNQ
jgi:Chaperone of endosialidase